MKATKLKKSIRLTILYLLVIIIGICMIIPLLYMISTSFREFGYTIQFSGSLIPKNPTLINFTRVLELYHIQRPFFNSLFVSVIGVLLVMLISSMMAYAFARFKFPGKEIIFSAIILVLMIPNLANIIPQFLLAKTLGLRNSLWGLIVFYTASMLSFNTFLLRGFFEALPKELEDAILIDGGNYFTVFFRMIIPLSLPGLATVAIFSFLAFWDELILALTLIDDPVIRTLPVTIASIQGQYSTDWGLVFAASLFAFIPVVTLFVALQRYFVGGLTTGAFKG
jgi:ABC-type glycerol-3-phosphate transport system permease component